MFVEYIIFFVFVCCIELGILCDGGFNVVSGVDVVINLIIDWDAIDVLFESFDDELRVCFVCKESIRMEDL